MLPFHYSYGLSVLHIHLLTGAAVVLHDGSIIDPAFRALVTGSGVTTLALVPTQFELLADTRWLPDLRIVTQAGGRIDPTLARRFAALARSEGWALPHHVRPDRGRTADGACPGLGRRRRVPTIGRPIPGGAFWLLDERGAEITGAGRTGRWSTKAPT